MSHIEDSLLSIYKQLLSGDLLPIFLNDYQSQIGIVFKNALIETAKIKYKKENIQNVLLFIYLSFFVIRKKSILMKYLHYQLMN